MYKENYNMKTNTLITIVLLTFLTFTGCSSSVTLQDMQKQKRKAINNLDAAKKKLLELANMKERYSLDFRKEQIKTFEKRQKQINKDIKSVSNVESSSAQSGANTMIDNLKEENEKLSESIALLQSIEQEDWTTAKKQIQEEFDRLERHIEQITWNLEDGTTK